MTEKFIDLYRHVVSRQNAGLSMADEYDVDILEGQEHLLNNINDEYDLVICSTLKRCRRTLEGSSLKYRYVVYTDLCREIINTNNNRFKDEPVEYIETDEMLLQRVNVFNCMLNNYWELYPRIAVIGHAYFLNTMRGGCFVFENGAKIRYKSG